MSILGYTTKRWPLWKSATKWDSKILNLGTSFDTQPHVILQQKTPSYENLWGICSYGVRVVLDEVPSRGHSFAWQSLLGVQGVKKSCYIKMFYFAKCASLHLEEELSCHFTFNEVRTKKHHLNSFVRCETGIHFYFEHFPTSFIRFLPSFIHSPHSFIYTWFLNHSLWPKKEGVRTALRRSVLVLILVSKWKGKELQSGQSEFPNQIIQVQTRKWVTWGNTPWDSHKDYWWISSCIPMFGLVNLPFSMGWMLGLQRLTPKI